MRNRLIPIILLAACSWNRQVEQAVTGADCGASGFVADAALDAPPDVAVDAAPDAPPDAALVTYTQQVWPRFVIEAASAPDGADGIELIGNEAAVPHEQGNRLTRFKRPADGNPYQLWTNTATVTGQSAIEDARIGDFDGDGRTDAVATADLAASKVYLTFENADGSHTVVIPTVSLNHPHWMQAAVVDMTGDGCPDIAIGGRVGTDVNPATVALLVNPCGAAARTASAWTIDTATKAGWVMSLTAIDATHLFVTDRSYYVNPGSSTHLWDLNGARIVTKTAGGWTNTRIATSSNAGEWMMGTAVDFDDDGNTDAVVGRSSGTGINYIDIYYGPDFVRVDHLPSSVVNDNVGHYQANTVCDIDGDGRKDIVTTHYKSNTAGFYTTSGIVWYRNLGGNAWTRNEISGPAGTKFDNVICRVLVAGQRPDVIANEQLGYTSATDTSQLGTDIWRNPFPAY